MVSSSGMGFSTLSSSHRAPQERMLKLHRYLQAGRYRPAGWYAERLEVSEKTVRRDFEFMRDRLGLPVAYEASRRGFSYTEEVTTFPTVAMTEGELLALLVARKAIVQYRGTPFERPLTSAFEKLAASLSDVVHVSLDGLDMPVSFKALGVGIADAEVFTTVARAVREQRELRFEHRRLDAQDYSVRRLQPYGLACLDNQWYAVGHDPEREAMRLFTLSRMREIQMGSDRFERPATFCLDDYVRNAFTAFTGERRFTVVVRFDEWAGRLVGERQWHASETVQPLTDGGVEYRVRVAALEDIERWVLSWGARAEVVEPPELRERCRMAAKGMLSCYGSDT